MWGRSGRPSRSRSATDVKLVLAAVGRHEGRAGAGVVRPLRQARRRRSRRRSACRRAIPRIRGIAGAHASRSGARRRRARCSRRRARAPCSARSTSAARRSTSAAWAPEIARARDEGRAGLCGADRRSRRARPRGSRRRALVGDRVRRADLAASTCAGDGGGADLSLLYDIMPAIPTIAPDAIRSGLRGRCGARCRFAAACCAVWPCRSPRLWIAQARAASPTRPRRPTALDRDRTARRRDQPEGLATRSSAGSRPTSRR